MARLTADAHGFRAHDPHVLDARGRRIRYLDADDSGKVVLDRDQGPFAGRGTGARLMGDDQKPAALLERQFLAGLDVDALRPERFDSEALLDLRERLAGELDEDDAC